MGLLPRGYFGHVVEVIEIFFRLCFEAFNVEVIPILKVYCDLVDLRLGNEGIGLRNIYFDGLDTYIDGNFLPSLAVDGGVVLSGRGGEEVVFGVRKGHDALLS